MNEELRRFVAVLDWDALRETLTLGGPVVVLLSILSVVVLALALLKIWQFARARVGRYRRLDQAESLWNEGRREEALVRLSGIPSVPARLLHRVGTALHAKPATTGGIEQARDDAEARAALDLHRLHHGIGVLDSIGQVAPLLGLFGTVLGMIEAFRAMEAAGAAVDPSALAGGIWVALLTTAAGLAVAMPASLIASWLDGRLEAERMESEARLAAFMAVDPVQARPRPGAAAMHAVGGEVQREPEGRLAAL